MSSVDAVAAGDGVGFVQSADGTVWRVGESVEEVATLPDYGSPVAATVGGDTFFGGVRCADASCDSTVAELSVLGAGGVETVELGREAGDLESSGGMASIPTTGSSSAWVETAGVIAEVGLADRSVLSEVPSPDGEPCVVDGDLFVLQAPQAPAVDGAVTLEQAASTAKSYGLSRWDGAAWQPVPGGTAEGPGLSTGHCVAGGYEVRDPSGAVITSWSPSPGWVAGTDRGAPSVGVSSPVTSSTGATFVLDPGGAVLDVTGRSAPVVTGLRQPATSSAALPPGLMVDEAEGTTFACFVADGEAEVTTRCAVAPDEPGGVSSAPLRYRDLTPDERAPVASPAVPPAGDASTQAVRDTYAHHYNLYSNLGGDDRRPFSRENVVRHQERDNPISISLNEVCLEDFMYLTDQTGLHGAFFPTVNDVDGCPGDDERFGISVLMPPGTPGGVRNEAFINPGGNCTAGGPGCWRYGCVLTTYASVGPFVACTTHLTAEGDDVAYTQSNEYLWAMNSIFGTYTRRTVAGDFNLEPVQQNPNGGNYTVAANFVGAGFTSAFYAPTWDTSDGPPEDQLDYIFMDSRTMATNRSPAPYCPTNASDHCYTFARWDMTL